MAMQVVNVPLGYRFSAEPHELIHFFLKPKILSQPAYMDIPEVEIYNDDLNSRPEILIDKLPPIVGEPYENEWYFFTHVKGKHNAVSRHLDRVCGGGCWRVSSKNMIYNIKNGIKNKEVIGFKSILTYHVDKKKAGDWIMHEYQINHENPGFIQEKKKNNWIQEKKKNPDLYIILVYQIKEMVLCHIHINASAAKKEKEKEKENSSKEEARVYDNVVPEIHHHDDFNNVQDSNLLNPNLVEAVRITNAQEQQQEKEDEDDLQEFGRELENYIKDDQNTEVVEEQHEKEDADLRDFSQNIESDLILDGDDENIKIDAIFGDTEFWSFVDGLPDIEEQFRDSAEQFKDNDVHAASNSADLVSGYVNGDFEDNKGVFGEEDINPADPVSNGDVEDNVHSAGTRNEDNNGEEEDDWSLINDDLNDIPLGPMLLYDENQPGNNNEDLTLMDFDDLAELEEDVNQRSRTQKRTRNDTEEDDQAANNKRTKY